MSRLAGISHVAEERAADPTSYPPPPLNGGDTYEYELEGDSPHPPLSSVRAASVDPVGVLSQTRDLEDALMLTLSTAIAAAKADAGVLHRNRPELGAVVTTYAQGLNAETLLGARLTPDDPSLLAARTGRTLIGEPQLGDAGRYIAGRFTPCLGTPRGVAMVPLVVTGNLLAVIEVARAHTAFRAREIARIEDVVETLTARIVVQGWLEE